MQLINYFQAHIMHSTTAALKLARKEVLSGNSHQHLDFAKNLIQVKNEKAHCQLVHSAASSKNNKFIKLSEKIEKYTHNMEIIARMEFISSLQIIRSKTYI